MANQAVTLFVLLSLGAAPERPVRNAPMPNGPQPEFVTIQAIDPPGKRIEALQTEMVIVPILVESIENGQRVRRTAYRSEQRMIRRAFALEKDAVYDTEGKKVPAQDALKRMKVGDTILLATQPVDPLYLRVIRPGTLIVVSAAPPSFPIPRPFPKDKRGEPPFKIELPPKR